MKYANPNPIVSHFSPVFDSREAIGSNSVFDEFMNICQELYVKVASAAQGITATEMETQVFAQVLQIGLIAMNQFFAAQAPRFRQSSVLDAQGRDLSYHGERTGQFYSIFGKVEFTGSYYRGDGHGYYPMDAALNLALQPLFGRRNKPIWVGILKSWIDYTLQKRNQST